MNATTKTAQLRISRSSPAYWRVTFDNPPLNVMGPQFVQEFSEIITAIEDDEQVKVVVFDSAVEGFFLNHSDFLLPLVQPGQDLFPLMTVAGGRYCAMGGGAPLSREGERVAGVGVSGGTVEQDVAILEAGLRDA